MADGKIDMTPTRGERNCNPGNIVRDDKTHWQGMSVNQGSDPRFCVFVNPVYGIRALAKLLVNYYRDHQLDTVRKLIDRWAPPNENDTDAYVNAVAKQVGCDPDDVIEPTDPTVLQSLTAAIITHENGRCIYDDATIKDGIERALA
jgi:hypothetical protein